MLTLLFNSARLDELAKLVEKQKASMVDYDAVIQERIEAQMIKQEAEFDARERSKTEKRQILKAELDKSRQAQVFVLSQAYVPFLYSIIHSYPDGWI